MKPVALILCGIFFGGCGGAAEAGNRFEKKVSGECFVTRAIPVPGMFDAISVEGAIDVEYRSGNSPVKVEAYGFDRLVEVLECDVEENRLRLKYKPGFRIVGRLLVRITVPSLRTAETGEGGSIVLRALSADTLRLSVSGDGRIRGTRIACAFLFAGVRDRGGVALEGHIRAAELEHAGSGDICVEGMCGGRIRARLTGSGNIRLQGRAETVEGMVSGSGRIDTVRLEPIP